MPDYEFPNPGLFTRFVLENPWPLGVVLAAVAFTAVWIGLRDGRQRPLHVAGVFALLCGTVMAMGLLITTPAEHGRQVTRELVHAAVAGDVSAALALFTHDAVLTRGSPRNPGYDMNFLRNQLAALDRYRITGNRITVLKGYTESPTQAVVELTCWTEGGGFGPTPSRWIVHVEKQADENGGGLADHALDGRVHRRPQRLVVVKRRT